MVSEDPEKVILCGHRRVERFVDEWMVRGESVESSNFLGN